MWSQLQLHPQIFSNRSQGGDLPAIMAYKELLFFNDDDLVTRSNREEFYAAYIGVPGCEYLPIPGRDHGHKSFGLVPHTKEAEEAICSRTPEEEEQLRQLRHIDGSPVYFAHPQALARAAAMVPWAKVLVMLRDPVERSFSQANMLERFASGAARTKGVTQERTRFEVAVAPELACYEAMLKVMPPDLPDDASDDSFKASIAAYGAAWIACSENRPGGPVGTVRRSDRLRHAEYSQGLLSQSLYVVMLQRAWDAFPNQLAVVFQEELYFDTRTANDRVLRLLSLEPVPPEEFESAPFKTLLLSFGELDRNISVKYKLVEPPLLKRLEEFFEVPNRLLRWWIERYLGAESISKHAKWILEPPGRGSMEL